MPSPREPGDQRLRLARHLGLTDDPASGVHHAHAAPLQRDIDPGMVFHGRPPMPLGRAPCPTPFTTPSVWGTTTLAAYAGGRPITPSLARRGPDRDGARRPRA